jgi:hypothetical protein
MAIPPGAVGMLRVQGMELLPAGKLPQVRGNPLEMADINGHVEGGRVRGEYMKHTEGTRRFLDMFNGRAVMVKGTMGEEVYWLPLRFLGPNSCFYRNYCRGIWHLAVRGRRIW